MKKPLLLIIVLSVCYSWAADAQIAGPAWKLAGRATFGKVYFDMYAKTGSWGMGQQFYGANFYNGIPYKVHVKAEYVANLVCGNEAVSHVDFVVDKYSSMNRVNPDATGQAESWMSDNTKLVWAADEKDCLGDEILVDGYYGQKTRNRIKSLEIRKLALFAVMDDGTEVDMTDIGELINPPSGTQKTTAADNHAQSGQQNNAVNNTVSPQARQEYNTINQSAQPAQPINNTQNNTVIIVTPDNPPGAMTQGLSDELNAGSASLNKMHNDNQAAKSDVDNQQNEVKGSMKDAFGSLKFKHPASDSTNKKK